MFAVADIIGTYRESFVSGATTTIAAATATAGHIFSKRFQSSNAAIAYRLKAVEIEALLTTAFGAAQEVGYDVIIARAFTASPTGATQISPLVGNDAKKRTAYPNSQFVTTGDIRIANAGALTAGTMTLDSQPIARGSTFMAAIGAKLGANRHDFSTYEPFGEILTNNEGFVVRNTILMGATGVVVWKVTVDWEEVLLGN